MTYAKRKAARPAKAATTTEPWTLEAAPVYWVGVAVAAGAVTLWAYEMVPVEEAAAEGARVVYAVGVTVMVLYKTVGTQVEMVMVEYRAELLATPSAELVVATTG
jgi:hypothetical protein